MTFLPVDTEMSPHHCAIESRNALRLIFFLEGNDQDKSREMIMTGIRHRLSFSSSE